MYSHKDFFFNLIFPKISINKFINFEVSFLVLSIKKLTYLFTDHSIMIYDRNTAVFVKRVVRLKCFLLPRGARGSFSEALGIFDFM